MRQHGTACKGAWVVVWLLTYLLSVVGCSEDLPDPRQIYGLRDSTDSNLLVEVEEAIEVANAALAIEGRFALRPTWKSSPRQHGVQDVPVYLLRRPAFTTEAGITRTREALEAFRAELARTELSPALENCAETEPCAALMYAGTQMGRLTAEVYRSSMAVDAAATEIDCRCVMLIEDDLQKFKLIFGPSVQHGGTIVPLTWYVPWYALHEIGHRNKSFQLIPGPIWADLYRRTQVGLNASQQDEMRADAYAASLLGRACFLQPRQEVRETVSPACLGMVIQNMQLWFYGAFDKTDEGLRRQYLNDGRTHPNMLMRLLTANVVMTNSDEAIGLLEDFLEKREFFAKRFAHTVNPGR